MGCGASKSPVVELASQRKLSSDLTNTDRTLQDQACHWELQSVSSAIAENDSAYQKEVAVGKEILIRNTGEINTKTIPELLNKTENKSSLKTMEEETTDTAVTSSDAQQHNQETEASATISDETSSLKKQTENIQENVLKEVKSLSPEEVKDKYDSAISKITKTIENIKNSPFFTESEEALKILRSNLLSIGRVYFALKGASNADIIKLRRNVGILLYENNVVKVMCNVVIHCYRTDCYKNSEGKIIPSRYNLLRSAHIGLLNYSDASEQCAIGMCEHEEFLKEVASKLQEWKQPHMESNILEDENKMLKWDLGIIHNIAMVDSSISLLRSLDFTNILLPYLTSKYEMFCMSAILALSDIVEESNCELLQTSGHGIQFLLKKLRKALESPTRKYSGFSAKELGRAVGRMARSDANKKSLVNEGSLPLLVELVKTAEDIEEEREAFESIWMLAFDDQNKSKIMEEPDLVDLVVLKFRESTDGKVRKTCQGILWTLRHELADSNKYRDIGVQFRRKSESEVEKDATEKPVKEFGHVMISYQWADQQILKNIRDHIKRVGFPVWMDIDNMGGSTLQAMAEAIEDANVVLICMSNKYKNSPNCRAEAEYAFQKRKTIIPLIMERGYRPDGWLGMILGSKLFYDFSGKYRFEEKVDGLLRELEILYNKHPSAGGAGDLVDAAVSEEPIVPLRTDVYRGQVVSRGNSDKVKVWTKQDVGQWLKKHDLSEHSELRVLSGKEVSFLSKLRFEAPEYFYKTVETKLGIQRLLDLVKFIEAMDDLNSV